MAENGVQRFRRKPTEADMIRWDGSDEAILAIGGPAGFPLPNGSLPVWVLKSKTVINVPRGDWVVFEPDGSGVYPLANEAQQRLYEPANAAPVPSMWEQEYLAVQKVLDSALGTEVEDGAGYGIAADVALVAERMKAAEAKLEVIREQIAESLRRAAAGRREYAAGLPEAHAETRERLLLAADCHESSAQIVEDPAHLLDAIPSWRWTAEEAAQVRAARSIREHWGQDG